MSTFDVVSHWCLWQIWWSTVFADKRLVQICVGQDVTVEIRLLRKFLRAVLASELIGCNDNKKKRKYIKMYINFWLFLLVIVCFRLLPFLCTRIMCWHNFILEPHQVPHSSQITPSVWWFVVCKCFSKSFSLLKWVSHVRQICSGI